MSNVPNEPTLLYVINGNTEVTLNWVEPSYDGDSPILTYYIQYKLNSDLTFTTMDIESITPNYVIYDLTNGLLYNFQVAAINENGIGTYSSTIDSTPGELSEPTNLSGVGGNQQVALSWSAPLPYGIEITSYLVRYKLSTDSTYTTINTSTNSLNYTITGLTN
jgi:titin